MKKRLSKVLIFVIASIMLLIVGFCIFYNINLKAVSSNSNEVEFMVDSGSTYYSIIPKLKESGLIKNELCFKLYIKFNKINNLEAGTYKLNKNMSVKDIVGTLSSGNKYNPNAIVITFKEGKNIRSIASTIAKYTNNTEDDVFDLLKNNEYLNSVINDYWFVDNSILNPNIYYSLEGYLYPNTYEFDNKDITVKEIFKVMLDDMDKKLTPYKTDLLSNKYSIHQILTLSSIVELEGKNSSDRAGIAQVFYNRLNSNMALGSDVTTYYGAKVELSDRDLYSSELNEANPYNTRSSYLAGKLPIGPICNPSIESIKAVLYPDNNEYLYFVSDINGKTYFTNTYQEHQAMRDELIKAGLWYTYE